MSFSNRDFTQFCVARLVVIKKCTFCYKKLYEFVTFNVRFVIKKCTSLLLFSTYFEKNTHELTSKRTLCIIYQTAFFNYVQSLNRCTFCYQKVYEFVYDFIICGIWGPFLKYCIQGIISEFKKWPPNSALHIFLRIFLCVF